MPKEETATPPPVIDDGFEFRKIKGIFSSPAPGADPSPASDADEGGAGQGRAGEDENGFAPDKIYWFASECESDMVALKRLDKHFMPAGQPCLVEKEAFFRDYSLEPELGYRYVTQRVLRGDWYRKQDMDVEAKIEYQMVLRIDEENIRANFGLGLAYLALNQLDKGRYVFSRLVEMDESFEEAHKHLFNEFGIALRKKRLFDEAMRYYGRAAELSPRDENIYLNMARAMFEKGDLESAFGHLRKTFEINPEVEEAKAFLAFLRKRGVEPGEPGLRHFFFKLGTKALGEE
ncbi:tetratricopeptide repeat protein [Desulfolutivibrio sulfoxidireducens]|uniref:tetratricopeptide repeat protein n=1 Tax=Desulfolutivibrio sulfoxidireducens TaxID=2773299 RepID=UPI00159DE6D4|nr:tetratricopeptide repeat protein [Desulfolutivibrio sulfoxidireducens]QLA16536.1 tetratricopeptide repeat protein [Desulfolutivibrio sulfoxidireducens]QLA19582.1 tetratricopeptide repeat protein [Desulfolutivibrio sulfoxidireducens]